MEAARQRYGSADYRAAQGVMRQVLVRAVNETYEAQLDAVRCPVHLVWGGDDTVAPLEVADRSLGRPAPRGDLVVLPGVGHLTPLLAPSALRTAGGGVLALVGAVASALALFPAGARWLRVAQREHYLPGSTTRFAWRWWGMQPARPGHGGRRRVGGRRRLRLSASSPWRRPRWWSSAHRRLPSAAAPSRLALTRRLRLLAALWLVLQAVVIAVGVVVHRARSHGGPRRLPFRSSSTPPAPCSSRSNDG